MRLRVTLLVTIGLPGAGKSQLARGLLVAAQALSGQIRSRLSPASLVIEYDQLLGRDLINFSEAGDQNGVWKTRREQILAHVGLLVALAHGETSITHKQELQSVPEYSLTNFVSNLSRCHTEGDELLIILDDNMYYRSMRHDVFQLAKTSRDFLSLLRLHPSFICPSLFIRDGAGFMQIFVRCPLNLASERNLQRDLHSQVDQPVIRKMAERLEEPAPALHQWESCTLSFDAQKHHHQLLAESVFDLIPAAHAVVEQAVQLDLARRGQAEEAGLQTAFNLASWGHQLDLALRKAITEALSSLKSGRDPGQMADTAQVLNTKRREILARMKAASYAPHKTLAAAAEVAVRELFSHQSSS